MPREVVYVVLLLFCSCSHIALCVDYDDYDLLSSDIIFPSTTTSSFPTSSVSHISGAPPSVTQSVSSVIRSTTSILSTTPSTTRFTTPTASTPTSSTPPTEKPGPALPFEDTLILYITIPVLCLIVVIAVIVAVVLAIKRYRRMRKYRLHLLPLHNMDGSDDEDDYNDDDGEEDDTEAAFTISSMGGRQPILQFAESP